MTNGEPGGNRPDPDNKSWEADIRKKERRKLRARSQRSQSVWFGFGMFGVVGWSIAVPTLLGILLGIWIDQRWPSQFSWTLMLMRAGLISGGINAWNWVRQESGVEKHVNEEDHDDV